jgi:hypothetical protein
LSIKKKKTMIFYRKEVCALPDVPLVKIEEPPSAKAGGNMAGIARALGKIKKLLISKSKGKRK